MLQLLQLPQCGRLQLVADTAGAGAGAAAAVRGCRAAASAAHAGLRSDGCDGAVSVCQIGPGDPVSEQRVLNELGGGCYIHVTTGRLHVTGALLRTTCCEGYKLIHIG